MEDLFTITDNYSECIIYGAGIYGRRTAELLKNWRPECKIKCFAVSEKPEQQKNDTGIPIISFEEAKCRYSDALVIIAIKDAVELYNKVRQIYKTVYLVKKEDFIVPYKREMKRFMKESIEDRKIVFVSNWGKGYMCNGKYITEELLRQKQDVDIVWAVNDMECILPNNVRKVLMNSYDYFYELATARVWVDNNRKDLYISKREGQYYIQTWHGSGPLKKVEKDIEELLSESYLERAKHDGGMIDLFLSSTAANSCMYKEAFYSNGEIYECGSARNDLMFKDMSTNRDRILHTLGIENRNVKIVLYAPTYRDTIGNPENIFNLDSSRVIAELNKHFKSEFVMAVRFHPDMEHRLRSKGLFSDCINASVYEDTQELLAVSDVLITDYSSIVWDFSLKRMPVFLYQNGWDDNYSDKRFYCPISQWPYPRAFNMEELLKNISEFNEKEYVQKVDTFLKRGGSFDDGYASERAVERIMDVINNPQKYVKE